MSEGTFSRRWRSRRRVSAVAIGDAHAGPGAGSTEAHGHHAARHRDARPFAHASEFRLPVRGRQGPHRVGSRSGCASPAHRERSSHDRRHACLLHAPSLRPLHGLWTARPAALGSACGLDAGPHGLRPSSHCSDDLEQMFGVDGVYGPTSAPVSSTEAASTCSRRAAASRRANESESPFYNQPMNKVVRDRGRSGGADSRRRQHHDGRLRDSAASPKT